MMFKSKKFFFNHTAKKHFFKSKKPFSGCKDFYVSGKFISL